jgi:hypothetical protein
VTDSATSDGQIDRGQMRKPRISQAKPVRWPDIGFGHLTICQEAQLESCPRACRQIAPHIAASPKQARKPPFILITSSRPMQAARRRRGTWPCLCFLFTPKTSAPVGKRPPKRSSRSSLSSASPKVDGSFSLAGCAPGPTDSHGTRHHSRIAHESRAHARNSRRRNLSGTASAKMISVPGLGPWSVASSQESVVRSP